MKRPLFGWIKLGLAVLILIAALFYGWLAFAPTGYRQFKARHAEAINEADAFLRVRPQASDGEPAKPATGLPQATPPPAARPDAVEVPSSPLPPADFLACLAALSPYCRNSINDEFYYRTGGMVWTECILPDALFKDKIHLVVGDASSPEVRKRDESSPEVRRLVLQALRTGKTDPLSYASNSSHKLADNQRKERWESQYPLHEALDKLETLLLEREWRFPAFRDFPYSVIDRGTEEFCQLSALAILRADLRGDGEKAARLLERHLEAMRILRLGTFPYTGAQSSLSMFYVHGTNYFLAASLALAAAPAIPRERLGQAGAILDRSLLSYETLTKLLRAFAIRSQDDLQAGRVQPKPGFFNRFSYALLKPVAARAAQNVTMWWAEQWTKSDLDRVSRSSYQRGVDCLSLMKSLMPPLEGSNFLSNSDSFFSLSSINEDVHLTQLVQATMLWRRDHGRYPESIHELIPAYLDRTFFPASAVGWAVYRYEPPQGEKGEERPVFVCFMGYYLPGQGECVRAKIGTPILPLMDKELAEELKK